MNITSTSYDHEMIDAAIRDAHKMRSIAIVNGTKALVSWLKQEFKVLVNLVKHRKATTELTHTHHAV